jgi:hypothetical protein
LIVPVSPLPVAPLSIVSHAASLVALHEQLAPLLVSDSDPEAAAAPVESVAAPRATEHATCWDATTSVPLADRRFASVRAAGTFDSPDEPLPHARTNPADSIAILLLPPAAIWETVARSVGTVLCPAAFDPQQ